MPRRRWRYYRTAAGAAPVKEFLDALDVVSAAAIFEAMRAVLMDGRAARHVRGEIYEARARTREHAYRVLFAGEGSGGHVLLAVSAFEKKSRRTPAAEIDLAEARLAEWRRRGRG
ncbi:MAG TPA: type II toxin-antitoxin system RelE/ParE family toxin [Acidimicrobiia bacterium]|nr:type II toxin-antitoxin system RelE/ParE family toxin [Acidimicrobiia bacterium]